MEGCDPKVTVENRAHNKMSANIGVTTCQADYTSVLGYYFKP